jgi:hypothetical protein
MKLNWLVLVLAVVPLTGCQQNSKQTNASGTSTKPAVPLTVQPAPVPEVYRVVKKADGLSCSLSQDIAMSFGPNPNFSGTMSASANHFRCKDKAGKQREIELISLDPAKNAQVEGGKVAILTKDFGKVYRGNEEGKFGTIEMTNTQIAKFKVFLGF